VNHCGHRCCEITGNAYHSHVEPPATCPRCAARPSGPGDVPPPPEGSDLVSLGHLVADVVTNVAPEIPGLPGGSALAQLVGDSALSVYRAALSEPTLQVLPRAERQIVLAGRVGLALAFPDEVSF
jgi:hypothetical protein